MPPYRLSTAGLHSPLSKPYVLLSKYTAFHYYKIVNSLIMNHVMAGLADHMSFASFRNHRTFPCSFAAKIFDLVNVVNLVVIGSRVTA